MRKQLFAVLCSAMVVAFTPTIASAQAHASPSSVNVNAQGVTTAVITFSGMQGAAMAEALWCGEVEPALPATGMRCTAGSIFGQLPARYERTSNSAFDAISDVMTIPASVARRAFQDAAAGANSAFYYVRRFRANNGSDQYAAVTLRMTSGGAGAQLSLTDVKVRFDPDVPVQYVANGDMPSPAEALLQYTGAGRITGRWEIVYPGDQTPTANDLFTQGTVSADQRAAQRRYAQLSRFSVFLPPTGRATLAGPDPARMPTAVDGIYYLVLRIESAFDAESQRQTQTVIDGEPRLGVSGLDGGAAAFAIPMLRYVVGSGTARTSASRSRGVLRLRGPVPNAAVDATTMMFVWDAFALAHQYRVEVTTPDGTRVLGAVIPAAARRYNAPPWFQSKAPQSRLRWRVVALDSRGREVSRSGWSAFTIN